MPTQTRHVEGGRENPADAPADDSDPKRTIAQATAVMVGLTLVASAVNYLSNVIFGRLLTPASFGDLTALLALAVILATPTAAAQTVIAERVAAYANQGDEKTVRYLIRHATAHVLVISLVVGAVYAAAIPLLVNVLDLQAPGPAIALLPFIVLSYLWPYALGILQGFDRFIAYGGLLLGAAVMRIAFGVPWVLAGGGSGGAIAGQALGVLVGIGFVWWFLRGWHLPRGSGAARSGFKRKLDSRSAVATLAFVAFAAISNLDVLLAKVWLSSDESGYYAALVTIEKVVLFLPGAVAVVMVPAAARARVSEGSAQRVLRLSAFLVTATTLVVVIPFAIFPEFVVDTMFGDEYAPAVDGVVPIVIAGAALALLYLLVTYIVAIADRRWVWLLVVGVGLQIGAIAMFHDSAIEVATAQASVVVAVLLVNEALFHPLMRSARRAKA